MKKIYSYISLVALAAVSVGCAKELASPEELTNEISVNLSVPASAHTKTLLGTKDGSTYPVYWSESDVITLNGTAATEFVPSADGTSAAAKFKVTGLVAPYDFLYCGVSGTSDQVSFPAVQNYVADGFDPAAMPMYASMTSVNDEVAFSHLASLLKLSFTGENKISSVTLTAADESKSLSGKFTIGRNNNLLDGTLASASEGAVLTYSFGDGLQLSGNPSVFYIAIPAGTYEGGIILEVNDNEAGHMTVKVLESEERAALAAGKVCEFDNVVYEPYKEANLIMISDDATLQAFATRVAAGETTLSARVAADFTATSPWTPVSGYKGVFEGNGKTITGLDQPLFATLEGVVKNLTLNSTITASDAEDANWGIFAKAIIPSSEVDDDAGLQNCVAQGTLTYTPTSAVADATQIGGFVGLNRGGLITNCVNEAVITMGDGAVAHEGAIHIAGVAGLSQAGGDLGTPGEIKDCTNAGSVICNAQANNNINIGGMVGYQTGSKETVSGCFNKGVVKAGATCSTTKALHLGGIVGMGNGYIESSSNAGEGDVVSEQGSSAGTFICQGGVAGRINNGSRTYSGLSNAGNLTVAAGGNGSSQFTLVGGAVGRCDEGAAISECVTTGGKITYAGTDLKSQLFMGGIVGWIANNVTSCTNATAIELAEGASVDNNIIVGGIAGRIDQAEISLCTNSAAISNYSELTEKNKWLDLGGVVGWNNGATINNCTNTREVTNTAASAGYISVGGIVAETAGNVTGCTNAGIVSNSGASAMNENYLGGIAGLNGGNVFTDCTNNNRVLFTATAKGIRVGGIAGYVSGSAEFNNCVNETTSAKDQNGFPTTPDINVSNDCNTSDASLITVGGVVGRTAAEVTFNGCENKGYVCVDITSSNTRGAVIAGGIFGDNVDKDVNCVACENFGAVEVYNKKSPSSLSDYAVGGIAGYVRPSDGDGSVIERCKNHYELFIQANRGVLGGIVANLADGKVKDCVCTGTSRVVYSRNKSYTMHVALGGIVGNAWGSDEITDCFNAGVVLSLSLTGEYVMGNYVGGVIGWLEDPCVVTDCINTGAVICATGEKNANVAAIAGGIIGYKESKGTDSGNKNWGAVTAIGQWVSTSVNYPAMAGGVVGALHYGTIKDCYNYGDITGGQNTSLTTSTSKYNGESRAGSIAGYYTTGISPFADCEGTITECYVGGWLKNASYSKNWKEVTSSTYGGLIVGRGDDPTDCYFAPFVEAPQPE